MTIGQLKHLLKTYPKKPDTTNIYMYSDSEGNQINNLFRIEQDEKGLYLVPDDADLNL
jgi:hypothetical protein